MTQERAEESRESIVRQAKKLLDEINQIFTDVAWFNENRIKIGEPLINPDPDGEMGKQKIALEKLLEHERHQCGGMLREGK